MKYLVAVTFLGAIEVGALAISPAIADAADDANAAMEALQGGDYNKAITLFTRAIKSGKLNREDREYAYISRGKAYMGDSDAAHAVADFKFALKLDPGNTDTQELLTEAQSGSSIVRKATSNDPVASKNSESQGWGLIGSLAGKVFWDEAPGRTAHSWAIRYDWLVPQQVLSYEIDHNKEKFAVGQIRLEAATGKLIEAEAFSSRTIYGTVVPTTDGALEYFFADSIPARATLTIAADGSADLRTQHYVNSAWQDVTIEHLAIASPDEIAASGFFKGD